VAGAAGAALSFAHGAGVEHGALRPGNILLGRDGSVYVTDFGMGRVAAGLRELAADYLSPEAKDATPETGPAADQYALGLILFEALTTVLPGEGDSLYLAPPSAYNPDIVPALDAAILTALARDPAGRHADIRSFVLAFQQATAPPRPKTAPRAPGATEPLAPTTELDRPVITEAAGATIMLVMAGGQVFRLEGKTEYRLGRSDPNRPEPVDLDLSEWRGQELGVSRRHGLLRPSGARLYYTDLSSANGSSVNGARLYPEIPMLIEDGDELALGKLTVRVYYGL
jgi:serine/threonine protein kinase